LEPSVSNSGSGGRSRTWCPVVEFRAVNGKRYEIESGVCASPAAYDVGEQVEVDYDPANPADAGFGGFFTRHFVTLVLGFMGVIWTGMGIAIFFGMRERWR
ncbi:MAG: DUF3592 domain-containing protein, partial [Zavarzinia sp.]|nr:DUF3592 domain-containing protein [Zavarzinia sp.]